MEDIARVCKNRLFRDVDYYHNDSLAKIRSKEKVTSDVGKPKTKLPHLDNNPSNLVTVPSLARAFVFSLSPRRSFTNSE